MDFVTNVTEGGDFRHFLMLVIKIIWIKIKIFKNVIDELFR